MGERCPCCPLALGGASPHNRAEAFPAPGRGCLPWAQLWAGAGGEVASTLRLCGSPCPTSAMAPPLGSAPNYTPPPKWVTVLLGGVDPPEMGGLLSQSLWRPQDREMMRTLSSGSGQLSHSR